MNNRLCHHVSSEKLDEAELSSLFCLSKYSFNLSYQTPHNTPFISQTRTESSEISPNSYAPYPPLSRGRPFRSEYGPCSVDNAYGCNSRRHANHHSFDARIDSTSTSTAASFAYQCAAGGIREERVLGYGFEVVGMTGCCGGLRLRRREMLGYGYCVS